MPETELLLRFSPAELGKLEYLVRQRINHEEKRDVSDLAQRIKNAHKYKLDLLYAIQDKLERARLRV